MLPKTLHNDTVGIRIRKSNSAYGGDHRKGDLHGEANPFDFQKVIRDYWHDPTHLDHHQDNVNQESC